jgi:DNA-binding CsgD family transcriptional regulator
MNIEKFWNKVDKTSNPAGCWEWTGLHHPFGYGRFSGKLSHRISYELAFGNLTAQDCLLHQCDNPKCVNPAHLKIGTRKDNAREREQRNRGVKGSKLPHAILTEQQVLEIRASDKSARELASLYGVGESQIFAIRRNAVWRHI